VIVGGESFRRLLAAWERTTAQVAEAVVRDPRMLAVGARVLRSHLLWKRTLDTALDAAWAPFQREEN
jgi:hypothetical protein